MDQAKPLGRGGGRRSATALVVGLALLNSACTTTSVLDLPDTPGRSGLEATRSIGAPRAHGRPAGLFERAGRRSPTEVTLAPGLRAAADAPLFADGGETVTLNLVDVPIRTAANAILTELLGASFVIGDDVSGTVTLQTSRPVSRQALVDSFQSVLAARGYAITEAGGIYRIGAATDPVETGSLRFADGRGVQVGSAARIVPLHSISAAEMQRILAPIAPSGILRADTARNVLVLNGTAEEIRTMQETIALFDVDWMRGQSAAIFPLRGGGDPAAITRQLEALFGTDGGPAEGAVRFVPSREMNAILVIASNPRHLDRARDYIAKFDFVAASNTPQNFVYKVENRPAKELATIVQGMLASDETTRGVAAGLSAIRSSVGMTGDEASGSATLAGAAVSAQATTSSDPTAFSAGRMAVVADEPNNALIVVATKAQYDRLLPILVASDRMANQVLIEAVIAEVTLNDQLRFGLRWFFENSGGKGRGALSDAANGAIAAVAPGFSYFFADVNFQVVLNALASITNVKVISSPTLTVLDNRTARLQIGDQVPVVTQTATATSTSIDAPIVNKVEMKDTGVILSVTPRVNSNGHVLLNIEQEVSDVVRTTSSGIDSPTIRQRKVATTVVVDDGQSIALGGLVQETREKGDGKVPVLGDVPVIGAAFRDRTDIKKRTELVIFIRPRVMRNGSEAEAVTREFRDGLARLGLEEGRGTTLQRIAR